MNEIGNEYENMNTTIICLQGRVIVIDIIHRDQEPKKKRWL